MKKKIFLLILIALILSGCKGKDKLSLWEEEAQLGKFKPAEDNWTEIEEKAKQEKKVIVLSNTSRVNKSGISFFNKYGIEVVDVTLNTGDLFNKLYKEHESEIYDKDLILASNPALLLRNFLNKKRIYSFVPSELKDKLRYDYSNNSLSYYRFGGKALFYNMSYNREPPVDSWWDLTKPEWAGRIMIKDLIQGGAELSFMVNFVKRADEMKKAYKKEFGKNIELSGTKNAGYEFLKRFYNNSIIGSGSSTHIVKQVAKAEKASQILGISDISKIRYVNDEALPIAIAWDLYPVAGFHTKQSICINLYAPHPNASKLFIKWIFGDEKGGLGYAPFRTVGEWSVRKDVPPLENQNKFEDANLWMQDELWELDNQDAVFNFIKKTIEN